MNRTADKTILANLAVSLNASKNFIRRDPCGDWIISGRRGHVFTDGVHCYAYLPAGSRTAWTWAKKPLSFMDVTQDGDEEGILRFRGTLTLEQAETIRDYVGLRVAMSEEHRAAARERMTARMAA